MMKIEKGQPGYIKARKMKYLIWAVAEFAIVIAVMLLGYFQTGTKMNLFTILAILGCLPAAKMLVEFIAMAPHKSVDVEKYQELEEKAGLLIRLYDLVITSTEKVMPVDAMVISGHVVCGYTSSSRTDENQLSQHIKKTLKDHHYDKMTVKIFHDYHAFLVRAEGLNNMAAVQAPDQRKGNAVKKIVLSISM